MIFKEVEELSEADIERFPVWEFSSSGDTIVHPVENVPVSDLDGRLLGTMLKFSDGSRCCGTISNFDMHNRLINEHFITASFLKEGRWFTLARYHDADFASRGPRQLSRFLGISPDEIFPIEYDLTRLCVGDASILKGRLYPEPKEKLSEEELLSLSLELR